MLERWLLVVETIEKIVDVAGNGYNVRIRYLGKDVIRTTLLKSCYGGHFVNLFKNDTSISPLLWDAVEKNKKISSYFDRDGVLRLHTSRGVNQEDMHSLNESYIVIEGGAEQVADFLIEMILSVVGDNVIVRLPLYAGLHFMR